MDSESTKPTNVGSNDQLGRAPKRDTYGPSGTYGCACVSGDPRSCLVCRSDRLPDLSEQCECMCHGWRYDDDL